MAALSDPNALFAAGSYSRALQCLAHLSAQRPLSNDEAILRAELLALTGDIRKAAYAAERLRRQRGLTAQQVCRLAGIMGSCHFRSGESIAGTSCYVEGIEIAEKNGALIEEATLRVNLFRQQTHWVGPHQAAVGIDTLRRKTRNAGEPAISLLFQLGLVELAAKLGLLARARRHLDSAKALLSTVENRAIHAECMLSEIALLALESNIEGALALAQQLAPIADDIGSESAKFGVATNFGHLLLTQARFGDAQEWLRRGLQTRQMGGGSEIPLRDTLMLLHLSKGELAETETEAQTIDEILERTDARDSFFGLWHLVTRVKWLFHIGEHVPATALATDALPRIERMADRNLLERMQLLLADGLGRTGRADEGAALVARAVTANLDPPLEITAEAARVAGRLAAADDPAAAAAHFARRAPARPHRQPHRP